MMAGGPNGSIALHGVLAAIFFFALQRFGFDQSVGSSLVWGAALGVGAAVMAWQQLKRGR